MTSAEVLALIKEAEVKFVDLRFTDTIGKEHQITVSARGINEDVFEDGQMFDGSSLPGWKGINESDMILMLDPTTAILDIFTDETTLSIRCDVVGKSRQRACLGSMDG